jgi:hypothetical protein
MSGMDTDDTQTTEEHDIALVLGDLTDEQRSTIDQQLDAVGAKLTELTATLAERSGRDTWQTGGVRVELFESGQTMIKGAVEDTDVDIEFNVELRPSNFFDETDRPWRPGQPPRPMSSSAWDVEGEALVMRVAKVSGRKYTIQENVAELDEQRFDTPEEAVAAFAKYVDDLAELALSREPTTEAWQSDVDESGVAPGDDPPHEFV